MNLKHLDEAIQKKVEEKKLSGIAVAIRGPEGPVFEKGYGFRDADMTIAPDENTIFGIASMSKSMAALACAILAAEGRISLDDPVSKYLPNFEVPGNPKDSVTIRHLCMHTTGIPPMEPLEWSIAVNTPGRDSAWARELQKTAPNKMDTIEHIIDYIAEGRYPTLGASGEYMSYSNEGYAVLCYLVDAAAGQSLEDFLDERVFGPMGMTRTTLDIGGERAAVLAAEDGNITMLYERDDDGVMRVDGQWSILPPFRACANVKSTAHDMARYYQCLSNGGMLDGVQVIPAEAAELMIGDSFPTQEKAFYCLGLNKRVLEGHVICEHSGGLHGVSSEGALLKGENYGFAALCNQGGVDVQDIMWMLTNAVMGREIEADQFWLHDAGREFSQPEMLVGKYICHEGIPVIADVQEEDGKLYMTKDGTRYQLRFCGETWFQLMGQYGEKDRQVEGRCRFLVRDGKAWGVQVYTRVYQRIEE